MFDTISYAVFIHPASLLEAQVGALFEKAADQKTLINQRVAEGWGILDTKVLVCGECIVVTVVMWKRPPPPRRMYRDLEDDD